jgi:hypothetical protein
MRIVSIHLYKVEGDEAFRLAAAYEVSFIGFLKRFSAKQFLNFNSRLLAT